MSARLALKSATSQLHKQLDQHPIMSVLVSEDIDVSAYYTALNVLFYWHCSFIDSLEKFIPTLPEALKFAPHTHLMHLELDFHHLQKSLPRSITYRQQIDNQAQFWGLLYALEGSQMGGAMICKHIKRHLAEPNITHYFKGLSDGGQVRWQAFISTLESRLSNPQAIQQAVMTAKCQFEMLLDFCDSCILVREQL